MYICPSCGEPCEVKVVDNGIGPLEVHGRKIVDVDEVLVSECCEEELEESAGEYRYDLECDRADYEYDCRKDAQAEERL
jgi:hypothetical protein